MKVVRFKNKSGQRIWRVTWGDAGRFLGSPLAHVWPVFDVARIPTESERRYRSACYAIGALVAHNTDAKGFLWLWEGPAELAITIAKVALRGKGPRPMSRWAVEAMLNGWTPPKDWTPDSPTFAHMDSNRKGSKHPKG